MTASILHDVITNATNIASSTRKRYLRDLNIWIDYAGSDPASWTRKKAQAFYAGMLKRIKPQSANRLMASIRFAAKWWAIQESNDDLQNFAIVQEAKAKQVGHKQALTQAQARAMLDGCQYLEFDPIDLRDFAMIVISLETGMRRMSLQSMTVEHTFLDGDVKMGYPTTRVLMKGSDGERVAVPLSDTAIAVLRALPINRRTGPIFQALARSVKDDRTHHTPSGEVLSESAIHKIIATRSNNAGLKISPHVFRHTFVTWRLEAGFSAHQVAAVTGHKLAELGALGEYIDPKSVGATMRLSTPEWLATYVAQRLS